MKRIGIYLERKPDSGGAYQYCLAMLKALANASKDRYKIYAFCTYGDWKKITEPLEIETKVIRKNFIQKVVHYAAEKALSVATYRKYCVFFHPLAKKMQELEIDMCIYPCGDKISFMLDTPSVVTVFDLMHRYLKNFPEINAPDIYKSRERSYTNIAKYAQAVFVDSPVGKQQMLECYGDTPQMYNELNSKTLVLPMIAPDYVFENAGKPTRENVADFDKYIFYPAQLWKHKNHKNLLLAMAELKNEHIYVNLVICGSGKNAGEEVKEIIQKNKLDEQVQLLGYVTNEEMVALYQHARALVMPTFGGPTNIPQLEAFVLGCPVATSGIFGIPEQVGDAAMLFNPANIIEIKECIRTLWMDDTVCASLIAKGYEKANEYSEEKFREKLLGYLDEISKSL